MRILVTGGAGFIGSHLCRELVRNKDNKVIAVDNLLTGKEKNIEDLMDYENFRFIQHDIKNYIDLEVDQIYNAACPASPDAYQKSPTDTTKTCVLGMINLLELARKNHAKILQFSTSEVYGEPLVHPQPESYFGNVNPIGIRSCYDEGKRCAESLCFDYYREFGTKIKVIRIFNTYGPYMDEHDGRVVSNFITQALSNKDITIYGDGTQTRSFCYVDDLVKAIQLVMNETADDFTGPINLGNPGEFLISELADKVIRLTGSSSKVVYFPRPSDDPTQRKPDITLARKVLNWQPEIDLDEGLKKTIEYYKTLNESGI